jgi:hypothetical protein
LQATTKTSAALTWWTEMNACSLTTTGLGTYASRAIRYDYPDWVELPRGHSIDAPEFLASGQVFWSEHSKCALPALVDRRYAWE